VIEQRLELMKGGGTIDVLDPTSQSTRSLSPIIKAHRTAAGLHLARA